jgi:hypothetical protein
MLVMIFVLNLITLVSHRDCRITVAPAVPVLALTKVIVDHLKKKQRYKYPVPGQLQTNLPSGPGREF